MGRVGWWTRLASKMPVLLLLLSATAILCDDSLDPDEDAQLRQFFSLFPQINQQLGTGSICAFRGCITVFCKRGQDMDAPYSARILQIVQPEMLVGSPSVVPTSMRCSPDALNVTLAADALPALPNLQELQIGVPEMSFEPKGSCQPTLGGPLPANLPALYPALEQLYIGETGFSGPVPSSWFAPGVWPKLRTMHLFHNQQLQGQIPDLLEGALPALVELRITETPLGGTLPQIGGKRNPSPDPGMSGLAVILSDTQLTGTLPAGFARDTGLSKLWVNYNNLEGSLPSAWGEPGHFGALSSVDLSNNSLTGTIPSSWGRGIFNTPPMPTTRSTAQAYKSQIYLQNNLLEGSIPDTFSTSMSPGAYTNATLYVHPGNEDLCGSIPQAANLARYDLELEGSQIVWGRGKRGTGRAEPISSLPPCTEPSVTYESYSARG